MGDFKQRRLAAAPRVLHPSEDLSELPPLRSVVAGQVYHDRLAGVIAKQLAKAASGWMGPLVTLLGRLYAEAMSSAQVVFAHPPNRFSLVGFCQLMYC